MVGSAHHRGEGVQEYRVNFKTQGIPRPGRLGQPVCHFIDYSPEIGESLKSGSNPDYPGGTAGVQWFGAADILPACCQELSNDLLRFSIPQLFASKIVGFQTSSFDAEISRCPSADRRHFRALSLRPDGRDNVCN